MKHRNSPYTFGHQLKREIIITGRSMSIIKVSEYMQRELTDFELPPLGLNWGLVQMGVDPWTFPTDDHPFFLPPVSGNQSGTLSIHHSVGRAEWKWVGWVNSDLIDEQWRRKTNSVKCGYHLSENEDDWNWHPSLKREVWLRKHPFAGLCTVINDIKMSSYLKYQSIFLSEIGKKRV